MSRFWTGPANHEMQQQMETNLNQGGSHEMENEIGQHHQNYLGARTPTEKRLVELWEEALAQRPIGIRDNFFDLGGCSVTAVQLCRSVERSFDKKLEVGAIFEAPTIEQLAQVVGAEEIAERTISIVPLQPSGARPCFFCICLFVGSGPVFLPLTRYLGNDQPFYGLLPSETAAAKLSPPYFLTDVAQEIVHAIQKKQPQGPYLLGGFCADGVLAYETARLLRTQGEEVIFLALFEAQTREKQKEFRRIRTQLYSVIQRFSLPQVKRHFASLWRVGLSGSRNYLVKRVRELISDLNSIVWQARINRKRRRQSGKLQDIREILFVAERAYEPPRYEGNVAVFRCTDYRSSAGDDNRCGGWDKVVDGSLTVHEVPGDHLGILDEPNVQVLAHKLSDCLQSAQRSAEIARVR
jgi:thioesterase domain-containing protein